VANKEDDIIAIVEISNPFGPVPIDTSYGVIDTIDGELVIQL
jgi:hypothetical protein